MDGSAATVNGQHRIIFAPDVIPRYHKLKELKVLIDHETFHIYHHQSTGVFGADEEAGGYSDDRGGTDGQGTIPRRLNSSTTWGQMAVAWAMSASPSEVFCLRSLSIPRP